MPVTTKPEDKPSPIVFQIRRDEGGLTMSCSALPGQTASAYRILGGAPRFADRDSLKQQIVQVGMTPSAAEDTGRSFNATARQLKELGFDIEVEKT